VDLKEEYNLKKKKKKFVLGDTLDQKALLKSIRKDDPFIRVTRNCEIRIKNHISEMKRINREIDQCRNEIRLLNIKPAEDLPARLGQEAMKDIWGSRIKDLLKWRRHLRADIKFLNNQKSILQKEK